MAMQEHISAKFRDLVTEGRQVLARTGWDGATHRNCFPDSMDYHRFRTEAMNLIQRVCSENSAHYKELKRLAESEKTANNSFFFPECLGVLQAAQKDYEGGYLFDLRSLIAAELLGDFIDQAETLAREGYYVPAASLAGAVLEDTLRKLCIQKGIPIPENTKIDKLNADLARAEAYNKLIQKRITAFADIRNNADHGHPDKFTREDVEDMVKWVRRFTTDSLGISG